MNSAIVNCIEDMYLYIWLIGWTALEFRHFYFYNPQRAVLTPKADRRLPASVSDSTFGTDSDMGIYQNSFPCPSNSALVYEKDQKSTF